jgi:hypothetical protein
MINELELPAKERNSLKKFKKMGDHGLRKSTRATMIKC